MWIIRRRCPCFLSIFKYFYFYVLNWLRSDDFCFVFRRIFLGLRLFRFLSPYKFNRNILCISYYFRYRISYHLYIWMVFFKVIVLITFIYDLDISKYLKYAINNHSNSVTAPHYTMRPLDETIGHIEHQKIIKW